jgi:hypothetical protein
MPRSFAKRVTTLLFLSVGLVACQDSPVGVDDGSPTIGSPGALHSWVPSTGTVIVKPSANFNGACASPLDCYTSYPSGWLFYNDESDTGDAGLGSFVSGPATAALGSGYAQISVTGTQRRNLATYQFAGTKLADITTLKYSTYNPSAGNGGSSNRAAYINFNVDFDGSDTWQRRLVFLPKSNGTVMQDAWQEWDAINGGAALWSLSGGNWPGTSTAGSAARTWTDLLDSYPDIRIRVTDAHFGLRVGEPYNDGYTEYIDGVKFGTSAGTTTFDFEPETACTLTCYVNGTSGSDAFGGDSPGSAKKTIQAAVNQVSAGGTVHVAAGTYVGSVSIAKDNITMQGAGIGSTVLQGSGCTTTGIALIGDRTGIALKGLTVTGHNYGITTGNVEDLSASSNCRHGIWFQAGNSTNISFTRVVASNNNAAGGLAGRGLWMINGTKSNISIVDGQFSNNGLVGIDLSDGNATGVTITGNTVASNGDAGIGLLGAGGPGANLVSGNTVTNNGRYGIEIKMPGGNGAAAGAGSVVVSNNTVTRTMAATDARDYGGIVVIQRLSGTASVDALLPEGQPKGVVITGNTVSGYNRKASGSTGDGFGIVVEGTDHVVARNVVSGNDVGIQIQAANPGINAQNTDWFDRGNAPTASALINQNSITGNGIGLRNVGALQTNATCNWYGSPTGPTNAANVDGTGDPVVGLMTFSPWLVTPDLNGDNCNSGTARGFKTLTLYQLQSIGPTGSNDTNKRINDAITKITSSLARPNWVDDNRIDGKYAKKIFEDEKSAVASLSGIKGTVPAGATAAIQSLLHADYIIARTAIDDAAGGNASELAKAEKEMASAQVEISKGRFKEAIDKFKKAWEHAKKA